MRNIVDIGMCVRDLERSFIKEKTISLPSSLHVKFPYVET